MISPSVWRRWLSLLVLLLPSLFIQSAEVIQSAEAATCTSTSSGVWGGASPTATWDCETPDATSDVVIADGHTITLGENQTVASLTIQSGGVLEGASGKHLIVTGDWSNSGTFTHNGSDVTLDASSGTQTVSGDSTFGKLTIDSGGATVDFGAGTITIQDRLQHVAGIMQGNSSTFTFATGTFIGGSASNGKRFHNLNITGSSVQHSAGDMYLTGNLSVQDGALLTFSGSRSATFNGSSLQAVTLSGSGTARFDDLFIDSGAIVRLPAAADSQFTAQTLTNSGALQQVKSSVSGAIAFLTLKNQAGATVYQGLDVTPGSGTLDITVSIAGNQSVCNDPDGGSYRNRCFRLNSSGVANSSSVTLYTTTDEDDISNDAFFQHSGGVWVNRGGCADGVNGGGTCTATVDLAAGDNYLLIGDAAGGPTPIVLADFSATPGPEGIEVEWQTEVEIDFAGFYLWRAEDEAGIGSRISPFVPGTGSPIRGALYEYLDASVSPGQSYFYRLEAVDQDNTSEFFPLLVRSSGWQPAADKHFIFLPITSN